MLGRTDKAGNQAAPVSVSYTVLYAFGGFLSPVPNATVGSSASGKLPVTFRLTDSSGQPISASVAATLGGKLTATLSGQGITPVTAACIWSPAFAWFQCNIPIPTLTNKGNSYPYQIAAFENLTGSPVTAPPYTGGAADVNPETVYFRSGP